MANWDELNKEFENLLNSLTKEDLEEWLRKRRIIRESEEEMDQETPPKRV